MTLRKISDASIILSLFRYLYKWYGYIEQRLIGIYHDSQTCRLAKGVCGGVKICFRYSFLGRISETKQTSSGAYNRSWTVQYLINCYKRWKDKAMCYLRTSLAILLAKNTKKILYFSPVRIISIIVVIAVITNVFLSIVLQKQISLWGWLMRGLFLFSGVVCLFCKADWVAVKSNSIILRKLGKN